MPELRERPYEDFQKDFLKLCDHVLAKPDKMIELAHFTSMSSGQASAANKSHVCGTPACIAGYLPEVFPEKFRWNELGEPIAFGSGRNLSPTPGCLAILMGYRMEDNNHQYWYIIELFDEKWEDDNTDREEVELRRKLAAKADSYKDLCDLIESTKY
jgi:hypothetical protein